MVSDRNFRYDYKLMVLKVHRYRNTDVHMYIYTWSSNTLIAMSTPSNQILASKFHSPFKSSLEKWLIQKMTPINHKMSLEHLIPPESKMVLKD